jgi:thiamine-phosphate pyrophosphorylase
MEGHAVPPNRFHVQVISGRLRPVERTMPDLRAVIDAGVDSLQLRDEPAGITAMIQALKRDGDWPRDRLVVNDATQVAGSFGVRWVHLPARWLDQTPPFGKFARIGISVHSVSEALEAESLGADLVTFGHVYASASHPDEPPRGLEELAEVVERVRIPVLAVGGISHANVTAVLEAGVSGVAAISAVLGHAEPGYAASRLVELVHASTATPRIPLSPLPPSTHSGSSR